MSQLVNYEREMNRKSPWSIISGKTYVQNYTVSGEQVTNLLQRPQYYVGVKCLIAEIDPKVISDVMKNFSAMDSERKNTPR